jgi:aromatic-L-amino-acid/L-tryptophan decarboxylase
MSQTTSHHMTTDELRRRGHELIDWIADYLDRVETFPVLSLVAPGDVRKRLPEDPPETGESFDTVLADVENIILPGITHWQSPNFFAYFPSNSSGPSILGELLSAGLGVQGMIWATSPAATELETHVLDWLVGMLDLPDFFHSRTEGGGVIQDTASSAALCALVAARERKTGLATNRAGCRGGLVAYTSSHAHSSIEKAVKIAGIGREQLRLVEVDADYAMSAGALAERIAFDRKEGLEPFFVSATVGTTSSNAIDPLPEIGRIARDNDLWLHVDAAMSGTAALCPEFRHIHDGIELADSYCFNPHKWMFTNFDCTAFYVRRRKDLIDALTILPEYLRNEATASGAVIDYRDWHVQLGRRFRALKLWFVIRHYGVEGLRFHVRRHVAMAQELVRLIRADDRFELAAPAPLNLVCFRHRGGDSVNEELLKHLNESGRLYLTHTKLDGRTTLRMSVGQARTEERHVRAAWDAIATAAPPL